MSVKSGQHHTEWYVYDRDQVAMDVNSLNQVVNEYGYYPGTDQLFAIKNATFTGATVTDPIFNSSVRGIVSASGGGLIKLYQTGYWGAIGADTGVVTRFRMAGRELDRETGLYYMRARYYDPQLGRFLSEDPIGVGGGLNLYAYAGNDPINARDPSGLFAGQYDPEDPYFLDDNEHSYYFGDRNWADRWVYGGMPLHWGMNLNVDPYMHQPGELPVGGWSGPSRAQIYRRSDPHWKSRPAQPKKDSRLGGFLGCMGDYFQNTWLGNANRTGIVMAAYGAYVTGAAGYGVGAVGGGIIGGLIGAPEAGVGGALLASVGAEVGGTWAGAAGAALGANVGYALGFIGAAGGAPLGEALYCVGK